MTNRPDDAARLARLLADIEELEGTRRTLLERVERTRYGLLAEGDRTVAIRASLDLLCDHITDVAAAVVELDMLEDEMLEVDQRLDEIGKETSGLAFESESLSETINEANEELERLSSILVERKGKHPKGH